MLSFLLQVSATSARQSVFFPKNWFVLYRTTYTSVFLLYLKKKSFILCTNAIYTDWDGWAGLWMWLVGLRMSRCRARVAEGKGAASSCALCTVRVGSFRSSPQLTGTDCGAWEGAGTAPSRSWRHLRSPWLWRWRRRAVLCGLACSRCHIRLCCTVWLEERSVGSCTVCSCKN